MKVDEEGKEDEEEEYEERGEGRAGKYSSAIFC